MSKSRKYYNAAAARMEQASDPPMSPAERARLADMHATRMTDDDIHREEENASQQLALIVKETQLMYASLPPGQRDHLTVNQIMTKLGRRSALRHMRTIMPYKKTVVHEYIKMMSPQTASAGTPSTSHTRPRGRAPKGKVWDTEAGDWKDVPRRPPGRAPKGKVWNSTSGSWQDA
tara:strand:- start:28531 stop:29055 length:525 start_codon:yes stop_codon:yes gene_type:complete